MRIGIAVLAFVFALFSIVGVAFAGTIMWEDGGGGDIYWNAGRVGIGSTYTSSNGLTIVGAEDTAYEDVAPNISNTLLSILNMQTSESANDMSMIQFVVNGGTYNRIGAIGLVAESESNREAALVFTTDDGGSREEKMRISGNGNVGIGASNPSAKLHVFGDIRLYDSTCEIENDLDNKVVNRSTVRLGDENIYGYVNGNYFETILPSGKQVGNTSNTKYIQGFNSSQYVRGGHLYGNSYGLFGLSYVRDGGVIHGNSISVYGQGAIATDGHVTGDLIGVYGNVSASAGQVDGKRWAGYFNGNTYVNGNLGIGVTSPDYKLEVNGTIAAKEVKVTTDISANEYKVNDAQWSDFVFGDSYKLPSLDHVENYIKENKHLPDVPSAKQIEKDGLSMAEMMAKQMQKIEELTLYVITQNKKIDRLERELAELKEVNSKGRVNQILDKQK